MTRAIKIQPIKYYTLQDIVRGGMFKWVTSFSAVRNVVEVDGKNKNILKCIVTGNGRGKKYHLKGENIIKFIKAVEDGKIRL